MCPSYFLTVNAVLPEVCLFDTLVLDLMLLTVNLISFNMLLQLFPFSNRYFSSFLLPLSQQCVAV